MAGENPGYTRLGPRVIPIDPHEWRDPADLVDLSHVETSAAVNSHAENLNNQVLEVMATAQREALLEVAREHYLIKGRPLTDEGIIEALNNFQISANVAEQQAYLDIVNQSVDRAAEKLADQGYTSTTLAAAIGRAVESTGSTLSGAANDLGNMDMSQILTIAGMTGGTYLLTGSKGWTALAGGISVAMASPALTQGAIGVGEGALRGVGQLAVFPVKAGLRVTDIVNGIGQPGLVDNIANNAYGLFQDVYDSAAFTLDSQYNPNSPGANPLMQEFLNLGEEYAPAELKPLITYLEELRAGDVNRLPTRAELDAAGTFLKNIEGAVMPEEWAGINAKRLEGTALTPEEKQKYVVGKYCMIINSSFLGENAIQPQGTVMQAAYDAAAAGTIKIEDVPVVAGLDTHRFAWTEEQMAGMEEKARGLMGNVNFENLFKHGFVGFALTAYVALTVAGHTIVPLIKGTAGVIKGNPEKRAERATVADDKPMSDANQNKLRTLLENNTTKLSAIAAALKDGDVLDGESKINANLGDLKLSDLTQEQRNSLEDSIGNNRSDLRSKFFAVVREHGSVEQKALVDQRIDYYKFKDQIARLDSFYKYANRGESTTLTIGAQTFDIGRPERGQFEFTTLTDILQGINPRNYYRWMTNNGDSRTLRMKNSAGNDIYLQLRHNNGKFQFKESTTAPWVDFNMDTFSVGASS